MLREMFPEVSRDEVVRRLERCKGDMDAAVLSLLELTDMNYKEEESQTDIKKNSTSQHKVNIRMQCSS